MTDCKIEFSLKLEEQDVVDFQKTFIFKKNNIIRLVVIFALLIIIAIYISSYFSEDGDSFYSLVFGILIFWIIVVLPVRRYYRILKNTRKIFRSKVSNYNERHYLIDEEKIIQHKDNNNIEYTWEEILKVHKDKKIIALYISLTEAFIFPVKKLDNSTINDINILLRDKGLIK